MELLYDRTQLDLINNTAKGHYNSEDLNRVEVATMILSVYLKQYGYIKNDLDVKMDWNITDIPTEEQMQRYLSNVQKLIDAFYLLPNSPKLPETMNKLDVTKANSIEKILYDIDLLIKSMEQVFVYSGVGCSGQSRMRQQMFRRKYNYMDFGAWEQIEYETWNDANELNWEVFSYVRNPELQIEENRKNR